MGGEEVIHYFKIAKTLYTSSYSPCLQIIGVVKIKAKIMLWGLMLLFAVSFVSASCLDISSTDFYVDGDKESGSSIDVKPESGLEVKLKIENTCENPDIDIEDVSVTGTIEGIDDGDDLEEESDDFDLDAGKTKKITLNFDIPLEVEDDDYTLTILVEGEQVNDSTMKHNVTNDYNVDVKKQKHDVAIRKAELDNNILKCARTTSLGVSLINLGTDDEEEVEVRITSSELGLDIKDSGIELSSDPYDSDSKYSNSYTIAAPNDQPAAAYPIKIEVKFDEGGEVASKKVDLAVQDCPVVEEKAKKEDVEVIQEPPATTPPATIAPVVEAEVAEEQPAGIMGMSGLITAVIAIEVLVIIGGVLLIAKWLRKR